MYFWNFRGNASASGGNTTVVDKLWLERRKILRLDGGTQVDLEDGGGGQCLHHNSIIHHRPLCHKILITVITFNCTSQSFPGHCSRFLSGTNGRTALGKKSSNQTLHLCYDNIWNISKQVLQNYSTSLGLNVHALGFRLCLKSIKILVLNQWNVVFRFDGQLILPYMTPAQLEMEDGDGVDVFQARLSWWWWWWKLKMITKQA